MKPTHLTNLGQKGSTLLEALVALLLTGIIALGGAVSIGKILQTHRQSNIQQIAVSQLRVLLQSGSSLCTTTSTPTISVNNTTLNVSVTCTEKSITVNGAAVTIKKPVLSVTDDSLGGEVKVGESL
ncbi:prepilin-type N-terminal cleavage/methylation domain-containing protein [Acinetobacter sp. ANC 4636]|uniref:prepilin-type N-terminal cleavage/methylation domain-containing protein n=1 Tax=Acinetobacter sp. ANC 4635 TaxID=2529846 RepID=UPI00103D78D2|nr:prepilin-type N-terminal cleavage/methylation domain-containing protein [Acinetobacter sp. ANC 4635]TCB23991.1 prepilin-type cleavage/methylation domain-containing protein [Acinetobacter sp. ANC 4635]